MTKQLAYTNYSYNLDAENFQILYKQYEDALKIIKNLKEENEQLKAQLYCDDEAGVCNICKHHYLVKDDEELGYYNSRCKKGHSECARVSLKHCKDFEKEVDGMTENKRFTVKRKDLKYARILENGKNFSDYFFIPQAEFICDKLNELSEENEQLKKEEDYYKRELQKDLVCQAIINGRLNND